MPVHEHMHTPRQEDVDNANKIKRSAAPPGGPRISTMYLRNAPATSVSGNLLAGRFSMVEPDLVCPEIQPDQNLI